MFFRKTTTPSGRISRPAARGVTLVELLIVIPILVIIGGIVVSLFASYIDMFIASNDMVAAGQRADSVFRLLEEPILHAGLGLNSTNAENYRKNWKSDGIYGASEATLPFPARWEGHVVPEYAGKAREMDAVILSGDRGGGYYDGIGIAYAVRTGLKISENVTDIATGTEFEIPLISQDYDLSDKIPILNTSTDLRSWLTVPGTDTALPMLVTGIAVDTAEEKTLKAKIMGAVPPSFSLPMHQDLYRMKAVMAYAHGDQFQMMEITDSKIHHGPGSVYITTIDGVRGIRFKLSEDRKYIEVRVLVRGDSLDAKHAQTLWSRLRERWEELTPADAGIYFDEFVIKWRVRNLGERK